MLTSRPTRGAWIEICESMSVKHIELSRPTRGAWIEINLCRLAHDVTPSRPTRGAWIEICETIDWLRDYKVAPHTGRVD